MSSRISPPERRVRVGTVVWGGTLLAVGVLILLVEVSTISLDPALVALGLLLGIGVSLVIGGLLSLRARPPMDGEDPPSAPPS